MPTPKKRSLRLRNPRIPCGTVSSKRNKFVGATILFKGETRRVIGCAKIGDDESFYATRKPGSTGTRYTPIKKRAVRDLKNRKRSAVKLVKHKGIAHTSEALQRAWDKRYGVTSATKRKAAPAKAKKSPKKSAPRKSAKCQTSRLRDGEFVVNKKGQFCLTPKGKMTGAAKEAFVNKMAALRAAAARRSR
jgi:hypothetical protein